MVCCISPTTKYGIYFRHGTESSTLYGVVRMGNKFISGERDKISSPKTPNISFLHHTLDISPPSIIYQSCRNCSNSPRDTLQSLIKESKIWVQSPTSRFWQSQHYIQLKNKKNKKKRSGPSSMHKTKKEEQKKGGEKEKGISETR